MWSQVPEPLKAEIRRREGDILSGIKQYKEAAEVGQHFHRAVEPYLQDLSRAGLNPFTHTRELLETHRALAFGTPEQRRGIITGLAKQFGVQLDQAPADGEPAYVDPQVSALQSQLQGLQSNFNGIVEQQRQAALQKHLAEVNAFSADPKNFLYEEVSEDMARLLQSRAVTTLQEAYDTAVARSPAARQKLLDHLRQQEAKATADAAAARTAAAKRSTAANLRTVPKAKGSTAQTGNIEDTLRETAERIYQS